METAGKTVDEKELSEAMKDSGLGTPATRASIIETLITRGYVVRDGKALRATERGLGLIDVVDVDVKSAAMTGAWEARLSAIARGTGALPQFLEQIEAYVRAVVGRVPPLLPPLAGQAERPATSHSGGGAAAARARRRRALARARACAQLSTDSVGASACRAARAVVRAAWRARFTATRSLRLQRVSSAPTSRL